VDERPLPVDGASGANGYAPRARPADGIWPAAASDLDIPDPQAGDPDRALEELASSWRQRADPPSVARVDAPARGRAEVSAPYADIPTAFTSGLPATSTTYGARAALRGARDQEASEPAPDPPPGTRPQPSGSPVSPVAGDAPADHFAGGYAEQPWDAAPRGSHEYPRYEPYPPRGNETATPPTAHMPAHHRHPADAHAKPTSAGEGPEDRWPSDDRAPALTTPAPPSASWVTAQRTAERHARPAETLDPTAEPVAGAANVARLIEPRSAAARPPDGVGIADEIRSPEFHTGVEPLPQRVPAEPDVPAVPDAGEPELGTDALRTDAPQLARIATFLRDEDQQPPAGRPDVFDIPALLEAVSRVPGVREAVLRSRSGGVPTLRLELADDADPVCVSRAVARMLKERMGLSAEPPPANPRERPWAARVETGPVITRHRPADEQRTGETMRPADRVRFGGRPPRPPQPRTHEGARPADARFGAGPANESTPATGHEPARATGHFPTRPFEPARISAAGPAPQPVAGPGLTGAAEEATPSASASFDMAEPDAPTATGPAARVRLEQVDVVTHGLEATIEVRLTADGAPAAGMASGPAVDGYMLRLCASAAAAAVDELLYDSATALPRGRCFVEHAAVVPFGSCDVAVVVLLLVCNGWVEQLAGSALVAGDQRQAVVRATLAAVTPRLDALLP
jgi:hypothetical protein